MSAIPRVLRQSARQLAFRKQDFLPDMGYDAQVRRVKEQAQQRRELRTRMDSMSKEELVSFTKQMEDRAAAAASSTSSKMKYEDLPQSLRDELEGRDAKFPEPHPFGLRRVKALCEGTWVWPVDRAEGAPLNEFKQPMKHPDEWIEKMRKTDWTYWDDVSEVVIHMGFDRAVENDATLLAQFDMMLKCKQKSPLEVGHLPSAMLEMLYLWQFKFDLKANRDHWDRIMQACVLSGEWRCGYVVEDLMRQSGWKPDPAALKRLDEIAQFAWDKGYLFTPRTQGKDINDIFEIDTQGGVGAFIPTPDGWSLGFGLFEKYEKMKKEGVFKPAYGTPAWEEYAKAKGL